MKIIATDLDRTLLPNGSWPADEGAIDLFNKLTKENEIYVIYVTGRNLALVENAIDEYGVRLPDIIIGDVGTSIRKYNSGQWSDYEGWYDNVMAASPKWNRDEIRKVLADIDDGLKEQEEEHCWDFKQSYYIDPNRVDEIMQKVNDAIKGKFNEVIIYSFDSIANKGLIDVLPDSATKQTAVEYIAGKLNVEKSKVVYCGDSGNDIFPLTAGFSGVLVQNADEQLVQSVQDAMKENPSIKAYFAKGGFQNLSGYYTGGVLEGANHYGLFSDE